MFFTIIAGLYIRSSDLIRLNCSVFLTAQIFGILFFKFGLAPLFFGRTLNQCVLGYYFVPEVSSKRQDCDGRLKKDNLKYRNRSMII